MPADLSVEVARLVAAGVIVGTVAIPIGLAGLVASRRLGQPVWPRWQHVNRVWTGLDVLVFFGVYAFLFACNAIILVLVLAKWFRDMGSLPA